MNSAAPVSHPGGVVITIRNEDVLPLYLAYGVYGRKLRLDLDDNPHFDPYIDALATYACCREHDHVFFRCKGRIYYGGRLVSDSRHYAFYLNGPHGFIGRAAEAPQVWDESGWDQFEPPVNRGLDWRRPPPLGQPFLFRFRDWYRLKGRWVDEHDFYVSLSEYNYLLPTTVDPTGMTVISPGETEVLVNLFIHGEGGKLPAPKREDIELQEEPTPYDPSFGPDPTDPLTKEEFIAGVLANSGKLPTWAQSRNNNAIYDIPISPYRPRNVETADFAYYRVPAIRNGTIPNILFYVKEDGPADEAIGRRIERQYQWLDQLLGKTIQKVQFVIAAEDVTPQFDRATHGKWGGRIRHLQLPIDDSEEDEE